MSKLSLCQTKFIYDIVKSRPIFSWDDLSNEEKMKIIKMDEKFGLMDAVNKYIDDLKFLTTKQSLNHVNK